MARRPRSSTHAFAEEALDQLVAKGRSKKSIINTATKSDPDKQAIATPWRFIHALEYRFGVDVDFDLAATAENAKAPFLRYFTLKQDSLNCDWGMELGRGLGGNGPSRLAYLNPPFAHIKPWARKLAACRWLRRLTTMLVPASYSATWFQELKGKVQIDAIPRIQFEGSTGLYPKELVLVTAGFGMNGEGYWDWYTDCYHRNIGDGVAFDIPEVKGKRGPRPRAYLPDLHGTPFDNNAGRFGEIGFQPSSL